MTADKTEFDPRRAEPNQVFTTTRPEDGTELTLKADEDGVVHPSSVEESQLLDLYDLPVARKALREQRAAQAETAQPQAAEQQEG